MKEKEVFEGGKLESIEAELFNSFDPDESSIGGGPYTNTAAASYTPSGYDLIFDLDFREFET